MNLSSLKKPFSRQQPNRADPAHAYGSEEQLMEEFQRQMYTPPQPAARAGNLLSGLRDRLATVVRPPRPEAPVYSADTYGQESAPDLGWEAAFSPQDTAPDPEERTLSAEERFAAFRETVYSSPAPRRTPDYSAYPPGAYYYQTPPNPPLYEEIQLQGAARRENPYAKPVYEDLMPPRQRDPAPDIPQYGAPVYDAPQYNAPQYDIPEDEPFYSEDDFDPAQLEAELFGTEQPDMPIPPQNDLPKTGDWKYYFWSGSIVAGAVLTLFSFVYACIV